MNCREKLLRSPNLRLPDASLEMVVEKRGTQEHWCCWSQHLFWLARRSLSGQPEVGGLILHLLLLLPNTDTHLHMWNISYVTFFIVLKYFLILSPQGRRHSYHRRPHLLHHDGRDVRQGQRREQSRDENRELNIEKYFSTQSLTTKSTVFNISYHYFTGWPTRLFPRCWHQNKSCVLVKGS